MRVRGSIFLPSTPFLRRRVNSIKAKTFSQFSLLSLLILSGGGIAFAEGKAASFSKEATVSTALDEAEAGRMEAISEAVEVAEKEIGVVEGAEREGFAVSAILSHLHPHITIGTEYNDNIYAEADKEGDIIITLTPGFKFEPVGGDRFLKLLAISAGLTYYLDHTEHDRQDLTCSLVASSKLGQHSLAIANEFETGSVSVSKIQAEGADYVDYWKNLTEVILGANFARLGYDIGYLRRTFDYEGAYSLKMDRTEEVYSLIGYFRIAPKTRLLLEYDRGRTRYAKEPAPSKDSGSDQISLGVTGKLTAKLIGLVKAGFKYHDYEAAEDYKEVTYSGDIKYKYSDRTDILLSFMRTAHETTYATEDYCKRNEFHISGKHRLAFNPKFSLIFGGDLEYYSYPEKAAGEREDEVYGFGLGLGYRFKRWITFNLSYNYNERVSNQGYDYNNNVVTLTVSASY